ncbi:MAG: GNAT family N-acetyltransferase [Gammaproteobacteria bacterium]|nr:GNAT family N-acetyltransferase [Gammaproteobacteria bacterium]NNC96907.1 GNAT family N-acetyltransferase [Gammaproteobacteria bacterium]NNM13322.1 GNAT family N-acetyltransferase [Gammaproteobacteria bacterium]
MIQHNTPEKIKLRFSEAYLYFIALHEEQIVGVIGIKEYNDEPNHLYHLFVDKAYRRHGIARKMWDFYLEQCSEQAKNQSFRVNSSLMAVDVYKNFGFVENGEYFEKDHIPCVPMLLSKIE